MDGRARTPTRTPTPVVKPFAHQTMDTWLTHARTNTHAKQWTPLSEGSNRGGVHGEGRDQRPAAGAGSAACRERDAPDFVQDRGVRPPHGGVSTAVQ